MPLFSHKQVALANEKSRASFYMDLGARLFFVVVYEVPNGFLLASPRFLMRNEKEFRMGAARRSSPQFVDLRS
jgi:hypothetical protein